MSKTIHNIYYNILEAAVILLLTRCPVRNVYLFNPAEATYREKLAIKPGAM